MVTFGLLYYSFLGYSVVHHKRSQEGKRKQSSSLNCLGKILEDNCSWKDLSIFTCVLVKFSSKETRVQYLACMQHCVTFEIFNWNFGLKNKSD